jgi:AraC-like DNA-binding protein
MSFTPVPGSFAFIRKYFKPIQPAVGPGEQDVLYLEKEPAPPLQNYIHCYWLLKTHRTLHQPFEYRVVSDGCIDIYFNMLKTDECFVMGFSRRFTQFSIGLEFCYAGIRFYPSIFPLLFGLPASRLQQNDQLLAALLPDIAQFIAGFSSLDFSEVVLQLNQKMISTLKVKELNPDERFYEALHLILKQHGHLSTESDLNTGLSPRQLRRIFNFYIGTTPKTFSQVVRFQHVLNALPSSPDLKKNRIYFDAGYYDQAHFIKEFTRFYGVTPLKALQ